MLRLPVVFLLLFGLTACDHLAAPDENAALEIFCSYKNLGMSEPASPADKKFCLDHFEAIDDGETWQIQLQKKYWRRQSNGFWGQPILSMSKKTGVIVSHSIVD